MAFLAAPSWAQFRAQMTINWYEELYNILGPELEGVLDIASLDEQKWSTSQNSLVQCGGENF